MNYSDLINSHLKYGTTEENIKIRKGYEKIQENVVIAPWWSHDIFDNMNPDHEDYIKLENYLESLDSIKDFEGHIITTHDRLLLINHKSKLLCKHYLVLS